MENLKQQFLAITVEELKLQGNQAKFFPVRFHPDNRDLTNEQCDELAGGHMTIDRQDFKKKIIQRYHQSMESAGVEVEAMENRGRGQGKNDFKIIFDWLWQHHYLRWIESQGLGNWFEKLKQKALVNGLQPWLMFHEDEQFSPAKSALCWENYKDLGGDDDLPEYQEIAVNIPYVMSIKLPQVTNKNGYLVMLYKSQEIMRVMCPSQAFAVNNNTREFPVQIPITSEIQGKKPAKRNLKLTAKGNDEFLAIWMDEKFTLDELNTTDKIPTVTAKYIDLIFDKMAKSTECHVFHRLCRVI